MDPLFWSVLLLLLGLLLIVLEVFIPSGGMLSVMAALSVIAAIGVGFKGGIALGTTMLVVSTVMIPIVLAMVLRWWPHTPIGRLILIPRPRHQDDVLPESEPYRRKSMLGKRGIAKSKMLPSGLVKIDGVNYEAVSEGMAIDPGQAIKVVAVRTNRLIVRPDASPPDDLAPGHDEAEEELLARPIDSLGLDPFDDPLA